MSPAYPCKAIETKVNASMGIVRRQSVTLLLNFIVALCSLRSPQKLFPIRRFEVAMLVAGPVRNAVDATKADERAVALDDKRIARLYVRR